MSQSHACDRERTGDNLKQLWTITERAGGREAIAADLPDCIRSHYDEMERIAEEIRELGFPHAAAILAESMPGSVRARSGELGEIQATELVDKHLGYMIPVRRLWYKDGREMALRGDDFIGIGVDAEDHLHVLKRRVEKSRDSCEGDHSEARRALSNDVGRPTATSLLSTADRLMDHANERRALGRKIRNDSLWMKLRRACA